MSFGLYRPSLVPFMDSLKWLSRKKLLRLQTVKCEGKEDFYSPPRGDARPSQFTPSIKFASTHLYTWADRGTVRVKVLQRKLHMWRCVLNGSLVFEDKKMSQDFTYQLCF